MEYQEALSETLKRMQGWESATIVTHWHIYREMKSERKTKRERSRKCLRIPYSFYVYDTDTCLHNIYTKSRTTNENWKR